ncbi:ribonuclease H-like domain-containing protein [uncultured Eubacterium sp.]|uniref:ribonuclease H-like domain-containing protein n=1 Tax=uncultured Eubacterium sp. TaxID=165185 RepID=UPI0025D1D2CC|nr:ribonuclease H-like domain-containing protein [uncultured Eubacterium sp.]
MITKQTFFSVYELDSFTQKILSPDMLLLDIETTGLSAARAYIYCIGCSCLSDTVKNDINIQLFFAENPEQEPELLTALAELLETHKTVVTFNGNTFDLPFLKKRYFAHNMDQPFSDIQSVDLYREARQLKQLIQLPDYKQKSIETFLGCFREDPYTGKELIAQYLLYVKEPSEELLHNLLLHNEEDVRGMYGLFVLLFYAEFLKGNYQIQDVNLSSADQTHYCDITLTTEYAFPHKVTTVFSDASLLLQGQKSLISFPVQHGCLRHYFKDYKNYYYLPEEQTIIHKSLGACVDPGHRQKATKENCYLEKTCDYLVHSVPDKESYLRRDRSDTTSYFELPQKADLSGNEIVLSDNARKQLDIFIKSYLNSLLH